MSERLAKMTPRVNKIAMLNFLAIDYEQLYIMRDILLCKWFILTGKNYANYFERIIDELGVFFLP